MSFCHVQGVIMTEFGSVNGFIELSQLVATIEFSAIAISYAL
jgi:hypothetical protein